ncbi:MAG TPA: prephenate dehydrogenase/arogenate dehydrogenase family protein [Candidatus Methanofastidiosa archaeon]|nr:prephenate dehydrogenase/arogenate dehydrogenase family protein [Candidatus Methanofastidiosa archaeon]
MESIGIIGFGRFGQLMALHLRDRLDVSVANRSDRSREASELGVEYATAKECAKKDIVVPCVPISALRSALQDISGHIGGNLVCDVCSVKIWPARWMEEILPKTCSIMGTHPLFGPDTTKKGLSGKTIALCPMRGVDMGCVEDFLRSLGLNTVVTTPDEHDRQMASSLAMIHYLGNALDNIGIEDIKLATKTHEKLKELVRITRNDSRQLFVDMHRYNPYVSDVRKRLIEELVTLDTELDRESRGVI